MGLFRRKREEQDLYTGDAPVSAPGIDGEAPAAYQGGYGSGSGGGVPTGPAAYTPPAPSLTPPQERATAPTGAGGPPAGRSDPETDLRRQFAAALAQAQAQAAAQESAAGHAPSGILATAPAPARRRSPIGCFAVVLVVIGVAVAGSILLVQKVTDAVGGVSPAIAPTREPAQQAGSGAAGSPVTVTLDGIPMEVTVFSATAQPGGGWSSSSVSDNPQLIVDAQLRRTDSGTEPVTVPGWNWTITDPVGATATGDIITEFQPSLDGPELAGGQLARGFVSFRTHITAGTLAFTDGPAGRVLATWGVAAAPPTTVLGTFGSPVQGEISRPAFTVTADDPRSVGDGSRVVHRAPESGRYLLVDITAAASEGATGSFGLIGRESFVFVPDDGTSLQPVFGAVDDGLSLMSVGVDDPESAVLAFDTAATSGYLQLVDGAGRVVITWAISVE